MTPATHSALADGPLLLLGDLSASEPSLLYGHILLALNISFDRP